MKEDVEQRRRADTSSETVEIKRRALELGFSAIGITTLESNAHAAELDAWLAAGHAGTMRYLNRQASKRKDPRTIFSSARVAVVTLTNYFHGWANPGGTTEGLKGPRKSFRVPRGQEESSVRVAQYAWSRDYHLVLKDRHEQLAAMVREVAPGARTRVYVDAGPVPERELAQRAGLGWIGKNMMLIHPDIGSFTFIGVILTDADLAPDLPFEADRCGTCHACLDACPTGAFVAAHDMDARRCISYLTIEHRGAFDEQQQAAVGDWLFGCDVCQDVCPWNVSFAQATRNTGLEPRAEMARPTITELLDLDPASFATRFGDTPFERPGAHGLARNAAAVLANTRGP